MNVFNTLTDSYGLNRGRAIYNYPIANANKINNLPIDKNIASIPIAENGNFLVYNGQDFTLKDKTAMGITSQNTDLSLLNNLEQVTNIQKIYDDTNSTEHKAYAFSHNGLYLVTEYMLTNIFASRQRVAVINIKENNIYKPIQYLPLIDGYTFVSAHFSENDEYLFFQLIEDQGVGSYLYIYQKNNNDIPTWDLIQRLLSPNSANEMNISNDGKFLFELSMDYLYITIVKIYQKNDQNPPNWSLIQTITPSNNEQISAKMVTSYDGSILFVGINNDLFIYKSDSLETPNWELIDQISYETRINEVSSCKNGQYLTVTNRNVNYFNIYKSNDSKTSWTTIQKIFTANFDINTFGQNFMSENGKYLLVSGEGNFNIDKKVLFYVYDNTLDQWGFLTEIEKPTRFGFNLIGDYYGNFFAIPNIVSYFNNLTTGFIIYIYTSLEFSENYYIDTTSNNSFQVPFNISTLVKGKINGTYTITLPQYDIPDGKIFTFIHESFEEGTLIFDNLSSPINFSPIFESFGSKSIQLIYSKTSNSWSFLQTNLYKIPFNRMQMILTNEGDGSESGRGLTVKKYSVFSGNYLFFVGYNFDGSTSSNTLYIYQKNTDKNIKWEIIQQINVSQDFYIGQTISVTEDNKYLLFNVSDIFGNNGVLYIYESNEQNPPAWSLLQTINLSVPDGVRLGQTGVFTKDGKYLTFSAYTTNSDTEYTNKVFVYSKNDQTPPQWELYRTINNPTNNYGFGSFVKIFDPELNQNHSELIDYYYFIIVGSLSDGIYIYIVNNRVEPELVINIDTTIQDLDVANENGRIIVSTLNTVDIYDYYGFVNFDTNEPMENRWEKNATLVYQDDSVIQDYGKLVRLSNDGNYALVSGEENLFLFSINGEFRNQKWSQLHKYNSIIPDAKTLNCSISPDNKFISIGWRFNNGSVNFHKIINEIKTINNYTNTTVTDNTTDQVYQVPYQINTLIKSGNVTTSYTIKLSDENYDNGYIFTLQYKGTNTITVNFSSVSSTIDSSASQFLNVSTGTIIKIIYSEDTNTWSSFI